ncbi:hypothetical protein L6452_02978 [Arctium lappa]|uniref:Uncharacterized protein n=1 Tax=Arctium lappa TaxID=4217 RepID=A0ACB9FKK3_ARCLA|nr:hypothetical protein L6452_02978 [Arctium lappa]
MGRIEGYGGWVRVRMSICCCCLLPRWVCELLLYDVDVGRWVLRRKNGGLFKRNGFSKAGHGLLQLGSLKIVPEDLHFVLRMRHTFESLGYQSGFYIPVIRSTSSLNYTEILLKQPTTVPIHPPAAFNWAAAAATPKPMQSPNFQNSTRLGFVPKDDKHMFLLPHSSEPQMGNMMGSDHHVENDIKWRSNL